MRGLAKLSKFKIVAGDVLRGKIENDVKEKFLKG